MGAIAVVLGGPITDSVINSTTATNSFTKINGGGSRGNHYVFEKRNSYFINHCFCCHHFNISNIYSRIDIWIYGYMDILIY